jgi:hypothetical protein
MGKGKKNRGIIKQISKDHFPKKKKLSYRQRMMEYFERDPFQCSHCKCTLELTEIWHADYGWLYHYMEDFARNEEERWGIKRDTRQKQENR